MPISISRRSRLLPASSKFFTRHRRPSGHTNRAGLHGFHRELARVPIPFAGSQCAEATPILRLPTIVTNATTSTDCKACGASVPDGADVCPRCGTSQRLAACPLCGATTGCSPDPEFRYRCDVCGGPCVPLLAPRKRRGAKELAALKRAETSRKSRAKTRGGAIAAGLSAIGIVGLLGIAGIISIVVGGNIGLWLFLAGLLTAGPLFGLTFALGKRSSRLSRELPAAIDEAWMAAATDVVEQSTTPVTATSLAKALHIDEPQAEELLALLEASDLVRPEGNLAYRGKLRVDTSAAATSPTTDAQQAAEEEARAEAEALAQEQQAKRERL